MRSIRPSRWLSHWLLLVATSSCALAQRQTVVDAANGYDVATIKPSRANNQSVSIDSRSTGYVATNVTVKNLVADAYAVDERQVVGLPLWAEEDRYDVNAKNLVAPPAWEPTQYHKLLQRLLHDRFNLEAQASTKVTSVYFLERTRPQAQPCVRASPSDLSKITMLPDDDVSIRNGVLLAHAITLKDFAQTMATQIGATVIDRTEILGKCDLALSWTPARRGSDQQDVADPINSALQDQLGLQLKRGKGPEPIVVVTMVQRPTPN